MNKKLLLTGSVFGFLAILMGAFGAHGLKNILDTTAIAVFETGVKFQMYHAVLLLILPSLPLTVRVKKALFFLLLVGVLFFSGSIYGLATNTLTSFDFRKIAIITPVGGTLLAVAWGVLVVNFLKKNNNKF